jgi:Cu-Zn family superoxide dismutase
MLRLATTLISAALVVAGSSALAADAAPGARAELKGTDGKTMGEVTFYEGPTGVLIRVSLDSAPPGPHGLHLHGVGICEAADGFKSAGAHVHSGDAEHGLLAPGGPHQGDLPSLYVRDDGASQAEFFTTFVTLGDAEDRMALLDDDGAALVMHANHDDQMTQPGGGTGDRIACGVIEATD